MASAVFLVVLQVKSFGLALVEPLKKVLRERHECHQAKWPKIAFSCSAV